MTHGPNASSGPAPEALIVGAGIAGAALARALARSGARVRVVEAASGPAAACTGAAFGWLNMLMAPASADAATLAERRAALADWRRLDRDLGGATGLRELPALVWEAREAATRALARRAGARLVHRPEIAARFPALRRPPRLAALEPRSAVVEPERATRALLAAARREGAEIRFGLTVRGVIVEGGRAVGVDTDDGPLRADHVALCAGGGAAALLAGTGLSGAMATAGALRLSPALRLDFPARGRAPDAVISGPGFEIRRGPGGRLVGAASPAEGAGRRAAASMRAAGLGDAGAPAGRTGLRPMPAGGRPLAGPAPGVAGLSLLFAHPGLILAPRLAARLAAAILADPAAPPLRPPRHKA
ncbi:MAG: FAD-dependent oxidoreductase [Pseudomonadota bacterium]|nr:FAD-dependent oxidoreductase [Pseudomonadota bacterium]